MTLKHFRFPDIVQFRNTIKSVRDRANYHGVPVPTLDFVGTVKMHGTNATVVINADDSMYAQSRDQLITPDQDNMGFAKFAESRIGALRMIANAARAKGDGDVTHVAIYGEWAGKGILKGTALSDLEKMFVIFGIRLVKGGELNDLGKDWLKHEDLLRVAGKFASRVNSVNEPPSQIFFVTDFPTFKMSIDFARPELSQNQLVALTDAVEKECPVAKQFGHSGVGEGIVWKCVTENAAISLHDLTFKVKGEKHSDSKVKTTATVDIEKVNSINAFVDMVVTDHRLEKMVQKLREAGVEVKVEATGDFMKLVGQDIIKEETDTMEKNGLDRKEVMPAVSRAARNWWLKFLDSEVGLKV